jgi:spermidine synthase
MAAEEVANMRMKYPTHSRLKSLPLSVPFFRKLLSYLFDIAVEKRKSKFSGSVTVSMHYGQYKLSTKNAVYSYGKNYTSFSTAFGALSIPNDAIKTVLVLGFGLGSVVDLLHGHASIKKITAVDADETIIGLAKKYLHSPLCKKIEYFCEDALQYLQTAEASYDLIAFDIFIDDKTPQQFLDAAVLQQLKNRLNANGTLLYSKIDVSRADQAENEIFEMRFSKIFPGSFSIDTDGNKVFAWINK